MTGKLVIVVSHPIQHFLPFCRATTQHQDIDVTVVFCSRIGTKPYLEKAMNTTTAWRMDPLGGYEHDFLPVAEEITNTSPRSVNNPSVTADLECQNPNAVPNYGYYFITSLRVLRWCRRRKVPEIMIYDSEPRIVRTGLKARLKILAIPIILRQFSAILTVGKRKEGYFVHYGESWAKLFRSPIARQSHQNRAAQRARLRAELGIGAYDVVALTVSKLSKRNRVADVIVAARIHKRRAAHRRFVPANNGEKLDRLFASVEQEDLAVILADFVNFNILLGYCVARDMIVHASGRDPHALVTHIGLPLVLNDRVGVIDATDSARFSDKALVFPVGDAQPLANRVAELVRAPDWLHAVCIWSREILENLDMRGGVRDMCKAMENCAGDRP